MDTAQRIVQVRRNLDRKSGEAKALAVRGIALQGETKELVSQIETLEKVSGVLSSIGEVKQEEARVQIETLVTQGLQMIFGPELSFHIVSGVRGRTNTAEFVIRSSIGKGQIVETPVLEARGGGLGAVVGFLLRVVMLLLSRQNNDTVLLLDETFGMVSSGYEPQLSQFLRELVDKTGIQIILVTHSTAYTEVADKQYRFSLKEGITQVSEE